MSGKFRNTSPQSVTHRSSRRIAECSWINAPMKRGSLAGPGSRARDEVAICLPKLGKFEVEQRTPLLSAEEGLRVMRPQSLTSLKAASRHGFALRPNFSVCTAKKTDPDHLTANIFDAGIIC